MCKRLGRRTKTAGTAVAATKIAFGVRTGAELAAGLVLTARFEFAAFTIARRAAAKACGGLGIALGAPVAARGAVAECASGTSVAIARGTSTTLVASAPAAFTRLEFTTCTT